MRTIDGSLRIAIAGAVLAIPGSGHATTGPAFETRHELVIEVPEETGRLRAWFVLPQDSGAQRVDNLRIEAPYPYRIVRDSEDNRLLYLDLTDPEPGDLTVVTTFDLIPSEVRTDLSRSRPYRDSDLEPARRYLEPGTHIVINERIRELAGEIVRDERDPLVAARRIYDWILRHADYWVKDPDLKKPSGVGSTTWCLDTGTGNCTDFHSLFTSLARASGIPTRMVYGSFYKRELDGTDVDQSYHCWVEIWTPDRRWAPVDVALADLYFDRFELTDRNRVLVNRTTPYGYHGPDPKLVDYYFGNLEPRRVVFSRGRDLALDPPQANGPVNALPKAYVEIDGKVSPETEGWRRKLTYHARKQGPEARD